jgi:phage-related protein
MTADLVVDYDLLTEFERNLSFVEQEFKDLHGEVHGLDGGNGWGSDDIRGAMGTFADNWSYHRSKLESAIDALLQMVTTCKKTFQEGDEQLAKQLHADTTGTGRTA